MGWGEPRSTPLADIVNWARAYKDNNRQPATHLDLTSHVYNTLRTKFTNEEIANPAPGVSFQFITVDGEQVWPDAQR